MTSIRDLTALDLDLRPSTPLVVPEVDERAARRSLLDQIAKLERQLSALFCSTYPRTGFEWQVRSHGGPRLLGLADLERIRDDLAERLHENRATLSDRTYVEAKNRRLIEEMMLAPEKHKWMRIGAEDIGERGCKYWEVRPRLGLVGMLMGWWRVKISSGCPLPGRLEAAGWESDHVRPGPKRARQRVRSATRGARLRPGPLPQPRDVGRARRRPPRGARSR